jgi:hypothetical protein
MAKSNRESRIGFIEGRLRSRAAGFFVVAEAERSEQGNHRRPHRALAVLISSFRLQAERRNL